MLYQLKMNVMNIRELMLNNYVLINNKVDVICRVGENDSVTDNYGHGVYDKMIEGIPLTEEWLVKFGIKQYHKRVYFLHKARILLTDRGKFIFSHYGLTIDIKHVHTLQNLYFALTGEELSYDS